MSKFSDHYGKLSENIQARSETTVSSRTTKTSPGQLGALVSERDQALDRAEFAENQLTDLRASTAASIEELHEVPGRRRFLAHEEYQELKNNIRLHGIITPLSVERSSDGGYNIVSGHHRRDIIAELIGESDVFAKQFSKIPIHLIEAQNDVEEKAFYANLLHPSLPDYEKWVGLAKISSGLNPSDRTLEKLAKRTGLSLAQVGRLSRFKDLPESAHEILRKNPSAVGANTAQTFAKMVADGKSEQVIEAINNIVKKGLTQDKAIRAAIAEPKESGTKTKAKKLLIRSGHEVFCTLTAAPTTIRIEFKSEELRQKVQAKLEEMLREQAGSKN